MNDVAQTTPIVHGRKRSSGDIALLSADSTRPSKNTNYARRPLKLSNMAGVVDAPLKDNGGGNIVYTPISHGRKRFRPEKENELFID